MPIFQFLLLVLKFASRAGPCEHYSSCERLIFAITIAQAILRSCANYGLCGIAFPCFGAITCSHMPNACSRDLGVSRDLKYNLGITRVTSTKKIHHELHVRDVPLDSIVSPGQTYCPCIGFFIIPSKTLFLIYNSHNLTTSIGNLKCETSS